MTDSIRKYIDSLTPVCKAAVAAALLAALYVLAYSNSFVASFHYDDNHQIVDNPHIRDISNLPKFFTDSSLSSYRPEMTHYRPLTLATFAINHALRGYGPAGYHIMNLLLHAAAALLVFVLAGMVLRRAGRQGGFAAGLFAAAVFALHPIQTYAVTYISGRASLLAVFFCLLSLVCFLRHREGGGWGWATASALSLVLGVMSKEIAVNALFFFAAYDLVFTLPGLKDGGGRQGRVRAGAVYLLMAVSVAIYFALRRHAEGAAIMPKWEHGMAAYWLSEAGAFLMYARLMLLPMNQNVDYMLPVTASPTASSLAGIALAALMLWGLYRLRRARPELALFGLWFFAGFLLESVLVPITDIAVEYRLYMPMAGGACFIGAAGGRLIKPSALRRAAAVAILAILGLLTFNRNAVWATPYTLWVDAVKKAPYNARAHVNYATALLDMGRYPEAVEEFNRVLRMGPDDERAYKARNNLGTCYVATGRLDLAEAEFAEAVRLRPECAECLLNLGRVYYGEGRYQDAVGVLSRAAPLPSSTPEARYMLAMSLRGLGRKDEALWEMEVAVYSAPGGFETTYNLAVLYAENGMFGPALARARESLGLAADEGQRGLASSLVEKLEGRRR